MPSEVKAIINLKRTRTGLFCNSLKQIDDSYIHHLHLRMLLSRLDSWILLALIVSEGGRWPGFIEGRLCSIIIMVIKFSEI